MRHRHPSLDLLTRRAAVLTRPCPPRPRGCGARPGQPCRSLRTGEPLRRQPAHPLRLFPDAVPDWVRAQLPEPRVPDPRELASASHR